MTGSSKLTLAATWAPPADQENVGESQAGLTKDAIFRALEDVPDPEFPVSIVDMGLIVDARESRGRVHLELTFTSMGCPAMDMIMDDVRQRLLEEPCVEQVDIEVVWDPIWTSQRLTDEGKMALREMGIAV